MIDDLLRQAVDLKTRYVEESIARRAPLDEGELDVLRTVQDPAEEAVDNVPTLAKGIYRPVTPMLQARFAAFGRWKRATHGHWLSASDMAALWDEPADPLLREIREMREAAEEDWPNDASALFRPERLSLFAGSDVSNEKIYLLWRDFEDEPELWVYDSNGEGRYRDLAAYLTAYIEDDQSAFERPWRA